MKKRLLFLLLFTLILYFVSCNKQHIHSISNEWKYDEIYHWHSCEKDDCSELLDKTQHSWDEGVVTKEASIDLEGEKTYTCTVCLTTKVEKLPLIEHSHEFSNEYSHDEVFHWYSATCDHNEVKFKELHKYEYKQVSQETCTEGEILSGVCVCGAETTIIGRPARGHQVLKYESDNNATCTVDGTKTGKCDVCNQIHTVTDLGSALGHEWIEKYIEPSYGTDGEKYRVCKVCEARETVEVIPQFIPVDEFKISGKLYMPINSTQTLLTKVTPVDATNKTFTWSSSDEEVATVDENGNVVAHKLGKVTITATSYNDIVEEFEILVIETSIDSNKDSFYDGLKSYSGQRVNPNLSYDSYVKLGEYGIYVYQEVANESNNTSKAHVEWYFTLGNEVVSDDSLSVHMYYEDVPYRSYTYSSTTNVKRNDKLAAQYCDCSVKLLSDENGVVTYGYELFVNYSYFGLTEEKIADLEFIRVHMRALSSSYGEKEESKPVYNYNDAPKDYKDITNYYTIYKNPVLVETEIDGERDAFYNEVKALSGKRTGPVVTHDSYIKLGENGIYVYQLVTDGNADGITDKSHIELYFTLGDTKVSDDSLAIHIYYQSLPNIRTYTYSSTTNVKNDNSLGAIYCDYATKLISNENGIVTYGYELFIDYSYFNINEAPEFVYSLVKTISGKGNPLSNDFTGNLDYKDINNYEKYGENGYIAEIMVDGVQDEKYSSVTQLIVEKGTVRPDLGHETYVYLGKKGIYIYHIVVDSTELVDIKTHAEFYFQLGKSSVLDNSLAVHLYPGGTDNLRTYTYSSSSNVTRNNDLRKYCSQSINILSNVDGLSTYGYELFVDYSYFGLTEAPESIKLQVRSTSYQGGQLTNDNKSGGLDYKLIENYLTFDKTGLIQDVEEPLEIEIDAAKENDYNVIPMIGKRSDPNLTQESYVYLGEKGIYVYQLVTDGASDTSNAHVEWYFTLGDTGVLDNSLSVHLYQEKTPYIRSYTYSSTSNVARNDKIAAEYCQYAKKLVGNIDGVATYAYELFVDYSYFGLTAAPDSIKAQARVISGSSNPLTNSTYSSALDYKNIDNYLEYDENGYVYSKIGTKNLELDPSHIVSGNYEMEFSLQTLNALNKLSNVKFSGLGSEYITEIGNGRYKISIPSDKLNDFAEEQVITVLDSRNIGATFTVKILKEIKPKFKVLMIGNSYADDTIQWVHEICDDLGIEFTISNMFIGGCTLAMHLSNLANDANSYTYAEYDSITKSWIRHENTSISQALSYDDWNYVSLQQASARSGIADSYDDINKIIDEVLKLKDDVQFIWNMTWAYQQDSGHSSFGNYNNDQETMYNAIINAVETKVLTNEKIVAVSPAGTAIQNARTSFVGDNLTRDTSCHLSYDLGRFIAGLTMVGTMTGADLTKVKFFPKLDGVAKLDDKYRDMAIEAVINAIENPYSVTQSTFVE